MDINFNNTKDISIIHDVNLNVKAVLGSTHKSISEILNTSVGSLIELNKLKDADLDIYINNKLVARGKAVVIEDQFGVRITELLR